MCRLWHQLRVWLDRQPRIVVVSVMIVVLSTWGFIELAEEVLEGETHEFDVRLVRALRDPADPAQPIGPPWLREAARDLTALGSQVVLTFVTLAVAGFLYLDRRPQLGLAVLVASLGGMALTYGLKALFARPRPDVVPHFAEVYSKSFPSGHSMMSAVVYLTLGMLLTTVLSRTRLRSYVIGMAVLLALTVGATRVYLGVHYPSDVLGGWAAGFVWALGCRLVVRRLQRGATLAEEASN